MPAKMTQLKADDAATWQALCMALASEMPEYMNQKTGKPAYTYILNVAGVEGFEEVTAANMEKVAAAVRNHKHETGKPTADDAPAGPSTPAPVVSEWETFDQPAGMVDGVDGKKATPAPAPAAKPAAKPAPKPAPAAKIERREWPNLAAALAAAQGLIVAAEKNRENPFFKSRYATLESVWDACRDALSSNGLAVIQIPVNGEERGQVGVTTILCHASGEQVSGTIYAKAMKDDAQGYGSVITYLRRYSLAAFVGVTSEEDDDGNAATQQGKPQARR